MTKKAIVYTVDAYITTFPSSTQKLLKQLRKTIKAAAPKANESISYGMPAYKYMDKPLVYFGGFDKHIGFYATPTGHKKFEKELSKYRQGKGSVQFPIDQEMPVDLIERIVKFRVKENEEKALQNSKK
ncbi:MAG: iron chaperone [Chitinophagaceae bacterium]|jgi:uncharacterized protein YdhG (YjbR/CyaY superfamily)